MTRFILSFLFSFTCIVLYSQEVSFILQPDLSTKTAEGNDFLIIHRESQSAKDLYDQTLSTILSLQKYSNESIICKENEFIILEGFDPSTLVFKDIMMTQTYGLHYWTKIEFKDNKMRISAPIIKALQMGAFKVEGTNAFVTNHKIFVKGKPGKSKQAVEAREAMTKLLNDTISEIINPTNNSEW